MLTRCEKERTHFGGEREFIRQVIKSNYINCYVAKYKNTIHHSLSSSLVSHIDINALLTRKKKKFYIYVVRVIQLRSKHKKGIFNQSSNLLGKSLHAFRDFRYDSCKKEKKREATFQLSTSTTAFIACPFVAGAIISAAFYHCENKT